MQVRLHLRSIGEVVDGDAPVDSPAQSHGNLAKVVSGGADHDSIIPRGGAAAGSGSKRNADDSGHDWPLEHNKKNKLLCPGFQTGACKGQRGNTVCPTNRDNRHQCAICLGDHPACECDNSGPLGTGGRKQGEDKDPKGRGRGRGRDRGRARARGGGRVPWSRR